MNLNAPVAQLDRALPSEGKGHTFESCRVRQLRRIRDVLRSATPGYAGRNSVSWERRYLTAFGVRISALLFGSQRPDVKQAPYPEVAATASKGQSRPVAVIPRLPMLNCSGRGKSDLF